MKDHQFAKFLWFQCNGSVEPTIQVCEVLVRGYCCIRARSWATIGVLVVRKFSRDVYQGSIEILHGHEEFNDLSDCSVEQVAVRLISSRMHMLFS